MKSYPKAVLSLPDLLADLQSKGMTISDISQATTIIEKIGYYRFRGYAFHLIDSSTGMFYPGTCFDDVLQLYMFNSELTTLLFSMSGKIEVALRARLCESLLAFGDPLIYLDSSIFKDKEKHWKNLSSLCNEINRSNEVFILHNYINHDGQIPIWAAVEVMSFGCLSKFISNLITGPNTPYSKLVKYYTYRTLKGNEAAPSMDMFSSWIHSVVVLRNMCAHNSRIYNRSINKKPMIITSDQQIPPPQYFGLYQILLSMKYLRPAKNDWNLFVSDFDALLNKFSSYVDLSKLHLPSDWKSHLIIP